jgi:bla regulator protein blaR1
MTGALVNHLWQSTCFAIAAGLLTFAFRGNRAKVRYWLWFSSSVKFLVPFSLLIALGARLEWAPAARTIATQIAAPSAPLTMALIGEPFPERTRPAAPARGSFEWTPIALLSAWALGFAGVAAIRVRGWRRIRAALGSSKPTDIAAMVEVRSSPGLLEPGVVGLLRPVLLVPEGIGDRLTPEQLEAVVAHEVCHVRRRDNLLSALHMVVEAVFWFHPVVWWIGARLMEERERACDEEVLSLGGDPRVYAEGILNICKLYVESPLVCVSGVTGSNVKKRIEAIMANRIIVRLNFVKKVVLASAGAAALAAPIVIGMMNAPRSRAQSAPPGTPKFDSVVIQPGCAQSHTESRKVGDGLRKSGAPGPPSGGSVNFDCTTVARVAQAAYGTFASGRPLEPGSPRLYVDAVPIAGGPVWIYTDQYQVHARASGDPGQEMMRGPMMQALLEDRLKLKVRQEKREVPAYALTVAGGGAKMQPYQGDCIPAFVLPPFPAGKQSCWEVGGERKKASFTPQSAPHTVVQDLDEFALWLFVTTDRPVVNRTGLPGRFFMDFVFAPDQATPGALNRLAIVARRNGGTVEAPSNPPGPTIFAALQEQLGLRLEPITAPRDFLTIEAVERPAAQ